VRSSARDFLSAWLVGRDADSTLSWRYGGPFKCFDKGYACLSMRRGRLWAVFNETSVAMAQKSGFAYSFAFLNFEAELGTAVRRSRLERSEAVELLERFERLLHC